MLNDYMACHSQGLILNDKSRKLSIKKDDQGFIDIDSQVIDTELF